ncbi:helix-turn-helix transcriptional regulator [Flammeovirga sp. MY04]|uniref:helix-turn-helix domain-containing protein n=1 Tax=Flammeovirga sp. MY04 TaxID=1191459 RepID=UPI0008061574|nr:AraC family transcriptional regulator [Flammeovirga sp. MY04]ANQ51187.1 helix-turn-helix transcriptional regulator [Flammeovirga sp. MY04]
MVDSQTSIALNQFISQFSSVIYDKEEFGLHILKSTLFIEDRLNNYQKIRFTHFSIHQFILDLDAPLTLEIPKGKMGVLFHPSSNSMIINYSSPLINQGIFLGKDDCLLNLKQGQHSLIFLFFDDQYFDQGIFHPALKSMMMSLFKSNFPPTFQIKKDIEKLIEEIFSTSKRGVCQLMFLNGKLFELLSIISDQLINTESKSTHQYKAQIEKVKQTIDEELHIQYSISDLAKSVGINTSYLKKYFKETYEETIFEYANRKRMELAKKLLTTTNFSISYISEKVGYQHASHFSYAFKKNTGLTPNQMRTNF